MDISISSALREKSPSKQQHYEQDLSLGSFTEEQEHHHIKEEASEHGIGQNRGGEEEEKEEINVMRAQPFLVCKSDEQKNKEENFPQQETKTHHSPIISNKCFQTRPQSKNNQEKRVNQEPLVTFASDQPSTQPNLLVNLTDVPQNAPQEHHRCYLCNQTFSSSQCLNDHAFRLHSNNAGVLCTVCGETLKSTESFIVHMQSHKKPKSCYVCGKHSANLSEHMASHAVAKLHRCHICGRECGRKGDLKIHMRIHTGEKPFCCSFCGRSFTHSGHLRKHMRSHTGERPHSCHICGRSFLQSVHLKGHLRTHTLQ
uniref:Zinc finger protein 846-like n=1 Tax=Gouania willdenowi TaxID=441366 RepID=A0A8C5NDC3_GOUWI